MIAKGGQGFTLLELLIAMTLLGLLAVIALGGLSFGTRIWEATEERLDQAARAGVIHDFLARRLEGALPLADRLGPGGEHLFEGSASGLRFVSLMPGHLGAGPCLIEIFHAPASQGPGRMVLRWRPIEVQQTTVIYGPWAERVLIDEVDKMEFHYLRSFDARTSQADVIRRWQQDWPGGTAFPALIRLMVHFPKGDSRFWPELVVRPMVDGTDALRF